MINWFSIFGYTTAAAAVAAKTKKIYAFHHFCDVCDNNMGK
jgi:hypothetical protein